MSAGDDLQAWRQAASVQSRGISDEPIYAAFERCITECAAVGDALDFGAGTGSLTTRLQSSGHFRSLVGADLFPRPADLPPEIKWTQADLNERLPLPDGSFDVVIAAEVIEHLENPRAVAREMFRLLRPGGRVLLSTPNNESIRSVVALLLRGHFVAFGETAYPAHITALVRKDLDRILTEAGFGPASFRFTEAGGLPGKPARTWQSLLGNRARGLRFSDNVLVTAEKPRVG